MARTDTLPHFLTDVADSIRDRTGSQELISASEFDDEIDNIIKSTDVLNTDFTTNQYTQDGGTPGTSTSNVSKCPLFILIKKLPKLSLDFTSYTSLREALAGVYLQEIDVSEWDVSTIVNFTSCFYHTKLSTVDLSSWNPPSSSSTTNALKNILSDCVLLINANLSCFEGFWDIGNLVSGCTSLQHLDIRGLDLVNCSNQSTFLGSATATTPTNVPYTCEIIVADQTQKDYMTTNFPDYINVKTVAEYEVV